MKKLLKYFIVILLIVVAIVSPFIYNGYTMYKEALQETPLEVKIAQIKEKDGYATYDEIPIMYLNAVIAVEDRRFYTHRGVDPVSIGRAVINDIKTMSLAEGGSTITQQLCKNIYFTQEKKLERKVAEAFMAIELEKELKSKDEILELYANTSYFGGGCYTIKDAARYYYDKELDELTDSECIMLAGIPNAPAVYAPDVNPELAKQRQMQVINKMIQYGYLTQEKADEIIGE